MPAHKTNLFELALNYVDQGVIIYDCDLTVIGFNQRALNILNMPEDMFAIGDPFEKWVRYNAENGAYGGIGSPEERTRKRMAIARTLEPYRIDQKRPDDSIIEIIGRPIPGVGYITTYADITVRHNAEMMIRESELRFKDIAEMGSDWVWEMGSDLKFTYLSPKYFKITGFKPEDMIGTLRTNFADQDDVQSEQEKWADHIADLEARKPFRDFEYEFTAKNGQKLRARISGSPIFDSNDQFKGYRGIGTNITEVVRNAKALRESEELFRALIDNLPSFINLKDKDGRYLVINRKHTELFGFQQQRIVGKVISDFLSEKQADDAAVQEQEVIETKSVVTREREMQVGDKRVMQFLVTKFPLFDAEGEVARIATIGTDITQLKDTQAALTLANIEAEKARAESEAANRGKSDFLAAMSHDLRTPLNAIIGFADAISMQYFGPISEKYQEYSDDIRWSGEHLLTLIGDILDVTAIESGMLAIHMEDLYIGSLVQECRKIIQAEARTRSINILSTVADDLPPIVADRQAIKKIFLNLLANATKFTPDGGTVTISAEATGDTHILKIADTGIGIPQDMITAITDPFVKGGTDPYKTQEGAGLGLSIVKSLVNLHKGTLEIESTVGKGTTVTVILPSRPK